MHPGPDRPTHESPAANVVTLPNNPIHEQDTPKFRERPKQYTGKAFVTRDNIDTDQIIPAEYLTLVPSKVRMITHMHAESAVVVVFLFSSLCVLCVLCVLCECVVGCVWMS